mmetsp:Transcript_32268/g.96779  ORF Transcript_32268/g.96779 Transcript_32268/m.96779 type:complete len:103 (+) Transcript_32268:741-1049(+)
MDIINVISRLLCDKNVRLCGLKRLRQCLLCTLFVSDSLRRIKTVEHEACLRTSELQDVLSQEQEYHDRMPEQIRTEVRLMMVRSKLGERAPSKKLAFTFTLS